MVLMVPSISGTPNDFSFNTTVNWHYEFELQKPARSTNTNMAPTKVVLTDVHSLHPIWQCSSWSNKNRATDREISSAKERSVLQRVDSPRTSRRCRPSRGRTCLLDAEESPKARARDTLTLNARHTHDSHGIYHKIKENRLKTHLSAPTSLRFIRASYYIWRKLSNNLFCYV